MNQSYRRVTSSALVVAALAAVALTCARERKAGVRTPRSNTLVLRYQDFGPPSVTYGLLGVEWYQWNSQGPDDPNATDDVKVVVYRNVPLEEVRKEYPVVEEKQDYRYLEYEVALDLLSKYEADSFWDQYPEVKEGTRRTKERILEQLGE